MTGFFGTVVGLMSKLWDSCFVGWWCRWVMFGLAVGLLTEYATGSDFVEQLKIIISNLGIADVD